MCFIPVVPGGTSLYRLHTGSRYMCSPMAKEYEFSAILVINRICFLYSRFEKKPLFHYYQKENQRKPFINHVYINLSLA